MKKSLQTTNQIPAWQAERAKRLHRICSSIEARVARGEKKRRLIQWFAWYWKGRSYKCDPSRPLRFSRCTIERAFHLWKKGGQIAASLRVHYQPRRTILTAPILERFIDFCASRPLPSMKAAWLQFLSRAGHFGLGWRSKRRQRISLGMVRYHWPASKFHALQASLKAMDSEKIALARRCLEFKSEIRNRLPDRQRRRVKRETDFQI
jgi:hypothetical protein